MKSIHYFLIFCLALGCSQAALAQNRNLRKGDKLYEALAYPLAINQYEKGLKKERDIRAMERLADAYNNIGEPEGAEKWYGELVTTQGAAAINKFYYGQALMSNGKYAQARKWFEAYLQTGENPRRAARFIEACDYAQELKMDSTRYVVEPEDFNVGASDMAPVMTRQGMIYTSSRRRGFGARFVNLRDREKYFYDIYMVKRDNSKKGFKIKPLKGKVNSRFHEGPAVLSPKGDKIYFTRSNYIKGDFGKDTRGINRLKIFSATNENGKWKNVEPISFNDDMYSCGHPALSKDGQVMVFASDIPGGFGGTDLYMSKWDGSSWSTPINLGSKINTQGDEEFPYLHNSGTLFFSSNGHPGMGGLDIFAAAADGDSWEEPTNAGYPLNSSRDDFGITWRSNSPRGYFTSNRSGNDDIFNFTRKMKIKGTVVDSRTKAPLRSVKVSMMDASSKETKLTTDKEGKFEIDAKWGTDYFATLSKKDYLQLREKILTKEVSPFEDIEVVMELERDLIFTLSGDVKDSESGAAVEDADIRLISYREKNFQGDKKGSYFTELEENTEYTVIILKDGYKPHIATVSTIGKVDPEDFIINASLDKGNYMLVEGRSFVQEDKKTLPQTTVAAIHSQDRKEADRTVSRYDGRFWMVLDPTVEHYLIGSKQGYFASRAELPKPGDFKGDTTVSVDMPMVPYEIGAVVKIIYYDYNKSNITDIASMDLFEIIYFLENNPEASVELSSHTDSRGGDSYNEKLSQSRSDAAVGYITDRGIQKPRIVAKGYGEKQLVNKCDDGVNCGEAEHSKNRRTEIRVTKLDLGKVEEPWKKRLILQQMGDFETIVK